MNASDIRAIYEAGSITIDEAIFRLAELID